MRAYKRSCSTAWLAISMVSLVSSTLASHAALLVVDGIRTWKLFPHTPLSRCAGRVPPESDRSLFFSRSKETYLGYSMLVFVNGLARAWYHVNKD